MNDRRFMALLLAGVIGTAMPAAAEGGDDPDEEDPEGIYLWEDAVCLCEWKVAGSVELPADLIHVREDRAGVLTGNGVDGGTGAPYKRYYGVLLQSIPPLPIDPECVVEEAWKVVFGEEEAHDLVENVSARCM